MTIHEGPGCTGEEFEDLVGGLYGTEEDEEGETEDEQDEPEDECTS